MGPKTAKSGAQSSPALPKITQSETIHSLNYLYQSAIYAALHAAIQGKHTLLTDSIQRRLQLHTLAKKATLRLDPSIKKSFCRRCSTPLLAGLTCKIRSVTFPPSSRAVQTRCLVCAHRMRSCIPPNDAKNRNTMALRRRKIQQRKETRILKNKVLRYTQDERARQAPSKKQALMKGKGARKQPEKQGKWSQRARRRAGRAKALSFRQDKEEEDAAPSLPSSEKGKRGDSSALPRYASRMLAQNSTWDDKWPKETTAAEREAIRALRGNHIITSGVGRGGAVGKKVFG